MLRLEFLTCLKVVSRKVPKELKRKASVSKGILKPKTAKILICFALVSFYNFHCKKKKKKTVQIFVYLISEVLSNIYNRLESGAIIGDGDHKRAPFLVLGLAP